MDKSLGTTVFVYGVVLLPAYILYLYSAYVCVISFNCFPVFLTEQLRVFFECIRYIISFHSSWTFANAKFILNGYTDAVVDLVDLNLCYIG